MSWLTVPSGKPERSQIFSDKAIQTCLIIKELFQLPLRQPLDLWRASFNYADLTGLFQIYVH
ncbi:TPA: hypothetical protein JI078_01400 [Acinetobacter baumannii]|nr:hypothetical protein [Acinetobacter baumannii]